MTYPDALFFIGKCLTMGLYPERIPEIRETIRSGKVEWEQVVWVSTGQFVFAVLYLQFKRADLLPELPADLVDYMEEYTDLNRERNQQIIDEALEITSLLNQKGITPVFLKGTAHLLDNLYEDIAERAVGDIDFLVHGKDMMTAVDVLMELEFEIAENYDPKYLKLTKHYPRLRNDHRAAAVEVHHQILIYPHYKVLDTGILIGQSKKLDLAVGASVLSDNHQIIHNILNVQINDYGYYYGDIFLRQGYDLLHLSQRLNPLMAVQDFGKFFNRMNANLALTNKLFDNPPSLTYRKNLQSGIFLSRIKRHHNNPRWATFSNKYLKSILIFKTSLFRDAGILIQAIYNQEARSHISSRIGNPRWYLVHLRNYKKT